MRRKSRLKDGAFDWVKDTTKNEAETQAAEIEPPVRNTERSAKSAAASPKKKGGRKKQQVRTNKKQIRKRTIFVKFRKSDGQIVSIHELISGQVKAGKVPWPDIPDELDVKKVNLSGKLATKELLDIHKNYKIAKSGNRVKLTEK